MHLESSVGFCSLGLGLGLGGHVFVKSIQSHVQSTVSESVASAANIQQVMGPAR